MTPKQKAVEFFKKFYCMPNNSKNRIRVIEFNTAKQCALIAVDELIEHTDWTEVNYWQEVKQEIQKL